MKLYTYNTDETDNYAVVIFFVSNSDLWKAEERRPYLSI